jgi:transposase-like protein
MREAKTRKYHSPEFKAKVGLEAVRGVKTINEIGQEYGVHPVQVGQWKKEIQTQASTLFEGKRNPKASIQKLTLEPLIEKLTLEPLISNL